MNSQTRLPPPFGRRLDRDRTIRFRFEGREIAGFAGDSIASALIADGQWMISRSFKYHRPRGPLTLSGQDANTLVQIGAEPNLLADCRAIAEGLDVRAQNYFGSFERDAARFIEKLHRFLPVGFYYKTFHEKKASWKFWEPIVRRLAGLGRIDPKADFHHSYYDKQYLFADVAVIGAGPAGLAAASAAAMAGAEVWLIDENPELGGSFGHGRFDAEGRLGAARRQEMLTKLGSLENLSVLEGAVATGLFADHWLSLVKGHRFYKLRAKAVIVATGSAEQPAIFRQNDLPGILFADAAQRLMRLYGVKPGERCLILTANDQGYAAALDALDAGSQVAAIVDLNPAPGDSVMVAACRARNIPIFAGHAIREALPAPDRRRVAGAELAPILAPGKLGAVAARIACDSILISVGVQPLAHLLHHAGAKFAYCGDCHMFKPETLPAGLFAAGAVNGVFALDAVIADGDRAGRLAAAAALGRSLSSPPAPVSAAAAGATGRTHPWPIFPHEDGLDFVDFDEDLKVEDLANGIADGYDNAELLKRYSTVAMGPSQGKHSAIAALRLLAAETGLALADLSITTQRPPYTPEKFGHLAGRVFEPERFTAMHHRHLELGAQMMPAGLWWRPAYYGAKEKRAEAIPAEAMAVREGVGLIDVSTLGGLDIRGPDAAEFLERLYASAYKKLAIGRSRYALMLDQAGVVIDDGVACRLAEQHFYVTATTSGVDAVYRQMLQWNAQWRLDVDIANVTAAYAGVNLAGPQSRAVLAKLDIDTEISAAAFPYMGVRLARIAGIPARVMRVGFVGELGYEIHVPAGMGEALWDAILAAGQEFGIRPFGVEAQRLLRLEKGHIIVSQDTDGLTNIWEAGMGWAIAKAKPFFVGGRASAIIGRTPPQRRLVGFTLADPGDPCPEECHLVLKGEEIVGRVTSAAFSPSLGKTIGLAYVHGEDAAPGSAFTIKIGGNRRITGIVTPYPFYDPENKRQEM